MAKVWLSVGGTLLLLIVGLAAGCPRYNVWGAEMEGRAIKAKADGARQALVAQAQAELDAAEKRAKAVAIMGEAAKQYPEYRTQEFIGAFAEALKEGNINQIIYVPTEANIPVLEASRRPVEAK